jgi:hypothetical protein
MYDAIFVVSIMLGLVFFFTAFGIMVRREIRKRGG